MAMNTTHHHAKRSKIDSDLFVTSRVDWNDYSFLAPYETQTNMDVFLRCLTNGSVIKSSFSDLCRRGSQKPWKELFIEERKKLKSDAEAKLKRLVLNRLIAQDPETWKQQIGRFNEEIDKQMSDIIPIHWNNYDNLQIVKEIYDAVETCRKLQSQQRLFSMERGNGHSLLTLQEAITNRFLYLAHSLYNNPYFNETYNTHLFKQLFDHCLIIVAQPSGPECPAVTKYRKFEGEYKTTIKTRIICLLNPDRVSAYLNLSEINITFSPVNGRKNPADNIELTLQWQKRTINYDENKTRTFWYSELTEHSPIILTKMNSKNKPVHNQQLCQLKFQTTFHILRTPITQPVTLDSALFGLRSHAQFYPQYLAKVFISEVKAMSQHIHCESDPLHFANYINLYHKRVCGMEFNCQTYAFLVKELTSTYTASSEKQNNPSADIYETILTKLIGQIKFMSDHPFLAMMYYDRLFQGTCDEGMDDELKNGTREQPHMLIRYDTLENQGITQKPNIIFVSYDGERKKAILTHECLAVDISRCLGEVNENAKGQVQVFSCETIVPFRNFSWYYDSDLNEYNAVQTSGGTNVYSSKLLLRNTILNNAEDQPIPMVSGSPPTATTSDASLPFSSPVFDQQPSIIHTAIIAMEITGHTDLTSDAMTYLQEALSQWCLRRRVHGTLALFPVTDFPELPDDLDISSFCD